MGENISDGIVRPSVSSRAEAGLLNSENRANLSATRMLLMEADHAALAVERVGMEAAWLPIHKIRGATSSPTSIACAKP
jgi:hypothetical protein